MKVLDSLMAFYTPTISNLKDVQPILQLSLGLYFIYTKANDDKVKLYYLTAAGWSRDQLILNDLDKIF